VKKQLTEADIHEVQTLYQNPWFSVQKASIALSEQERRDFYAVHHERPAVGIVAMQQDKILLIKQYRYLIDRVVWAIPSGGVDVDETPLCAAQRELLEESGYRAKTIRELIRYNPTYGSSDQLFITHLATDLEYVGMDDDQDEVMDTGWFTREEIRQLIVSGEMPDGLSLVPLLLLLADPTR
jgi:8-oxo-dGTP pyrophosphatase MutT (NUDIX family)